MRTHYRVPPGAHALRREGGESCGQRGVLEACEDAEASEMTVRGRFCSKVPTSFAFCIDAGKVIPEVPLIEFRMETGRMVPRKPQEL